MSWPQVLDHVLPTSLESWTAKHPVFVLGPPGLFHWTPVSSPRIPETGKKPETGDLPAPEELEDARGRS